MRVLFRSVAEEIGLADRTAEGAEGVDVAVALTPPIDEFDAEFEGRLGRLHELGFVEPEEVVEILHLRQRRLADADGADLFGFDEADAEARGVERSEEHTTELQSLRRISYAVLCLKKQTT